MHATDVREASDRQTDRRQTKASLNAPHWGRGTIIMSAV